VPLGTRAPIIGSALTCDVSLAAWRLGVQGTRDRGRDLALYRNDLAPVMKDSNWRAIPVDEGGVVKLTTADLNAADPDGGGAALHYAVTATSHGQILVNGVTAKSFTQVQLEKGDVSFHQDESETTTASFSVSLTDGSASWRISTSWGGQKRFSRVSRGARPVRMSGEMVWRKLWSFST
jgi:Cadherin-like